MPRDRGKFNPKNPSPYELSRSKIEAFIKCPACFWLEKAAGVKFPGMPAFLLNTNTNTNTNTLLKKDFHQYRCKGPHPLMQAVGLGHPQAFAHLGLANRGACKVAVGAKTDSSSMVYSFIGIEAP